MKERMHINTNQCDTCAGQYYCVSDCITEYISIANLGEAPKLKDRGICIGCGRCMAICPLGAITSCDSTVLELKSNKNLNEFQDFMVSKRSVRKFINRDIEEEYLDILIQAA